MSTLLHVDMDAFYAGVEMRRNPELVDRPMWVGGQRRGVVLSANYPARSYGVHGGMAVAQALRLCPDGVGVRPDFSAYVAASAQVKQLLEAVTWKVSMASIDEAYLDVSPAVRTQGSPVEIGQRIRAQVRQVLGLACSVGIGPNRLIAKMASVAAKPDGLVVVEPDAVTEFLAPLPVERLMGVGESTAARLKGLGLFTIADLAAASPAALAHSLGPRSGAWLAEAAQGRESGRLSGSPHDRGVGAQVTFAHDLHRPDAVRAEILRVCVKVAARLRAAEVVGRTVAFQLRQADFRSFSRSASLAEPTDLTGQIYAAALRSYARLSRPHQVVRLVGVRVTGLVPRDQIWHQPCLDEEGPGWAVVERAVDAVNGRLGAGLVRRGSLARRPPE